MSNYSIFGCGLPSKPRTAEPSMFQILSWPNDKQLSQSKFEQAQQKKVHKDEGHHDSQLIQDMQRQNVNLQTNQIFPHQQKTLKSQTIKRQSPNKIVQQTYKQHKQQSKQKKLMKQTTVNQIDESLENKSKTFINSKLYQKQIKHELYSYQPVDLKSTRSKSAIVVKNDKPIQNLTKKQEPQLDEKTIQQRKKKIKEFQIFTRALPNSAFTTYYGKPAFQAYGRGTSGKNLKSYNIMPHKGDNHPKNIESHYTALMKGRQIKSKSYLPRKPIEQNIIPSEEQHENYQLINLNFTLQKPDLIKSNRFATVRPQTAKKAGPPIMQKTTVNGIKRNHTENKQSKKVEKKQKKNKQKKNNDGLKYMNERENLIDLLEEKKMKASQLAYKVTECYPSQLEAPNIKQSIVSKQNWGQLKPAGKATLRGGQVSDLIHSKHSKLALQQKTNKVQ